MEDIKAQIFRIKQFGLYHAERDMPYSVQTVNAFNTAIKAMEKQVEISPNKVSRHYSSFYFCPKCGMNLNPRFEEDYMQHVSYCEKCGQKIYWNNNGEK